MASDSENSSCCSSCSSDNKSSSEMKRVMLTASMCIHHIPAMRPDMIRLVQLLRGDDGPSELQHKAGERANACDLQDHTSSSYLNELTRHRQLLMECE